ncbi:uncharacterized protein GGS25DRAFT_480894, partial [Hypoxylon fragiforme]|uniref:uncharacterized protein n=1 Tax=Hypoxylon fragiforme TaxID=63214 RepID=UPI0020C5F550
MYVTAYICYLAPMNCIGVCPLSTVCVMFIHVGTTQYPGVMYGFSLAPGYSYTTSCADLPTTTACQLHGKYMSISYFTIVQMNCWLCILYVM